jgi:lactoylglutathione lyase
MKLAKPHLDLGMFTADLAAHQALWRDTLGLHLDHLLYFDDLWVQNRYDAHGSVIKVNDYRYPMPARPPCGYQGLTIARDNVARSEYPTPDGQFVRLVPPGTDGIERIGITVRSSAPARLMAFYVDAMAFEAVAPRVARCGDTLLFVEHGDGGQDSESFVGRGYRYLTVQIFDADAECAAIVRRGGRPGAPPVNFGTVARFGFVLDPDGNWLEISARTSLTGVAPPA